MAVNATQGERGWSGGHADIECVWPESNSVRVFDLSPRMESGMPRHPAHPPFVFSLVHQHGFQMLQSGISGSSEIITTGAHTGCHVDALGHVSKDGKVYGGRDVIGGQSYVGGLDVGSVEEVPPLIARAHLVDGPALFGHDLDAADGIGPEQFDQWFTDHHEPQPGSIVVVRTGQMQYWADERRYCGVGKGAPGVTLDGARWLGERRILATGTDTIAYEHKPEWSKMAIVAHEHLLVEKGIYIMECLDLEQIAAAGVTEFTFIGLPLRIRGGTGSPLRPVGIVGR